MPIYTIIIWLYSSYSSNRFEILQKPKKSLPLFDI